MTPLLSLVPEYPAGMYQWEYLASIKIFFFFVRSPRKGVMSPLVNNTFTFGTDGMVGSPRVVRAPQPPVEPVVFESEPESALAMNSRIAAKHDHSEELKAWSSPRAVSPAIDTKSHHPKKPSPMVGQLGFL